MRILIVEDEIYLGNSTQKHLKRYNYQVDLIYDGSKGLEKIKTEDYDLVLLDIMLPGLDGLSILKQVRDLQINVPIILTTAKSEIEDRITGLDLGADDYIVKPYDFNELIARIKANLRRKYQDTVLTNNTFANMMIIRDDLSLNVKDKTINLTLKEFNLLEYLINNSNYTVSKEKIIEQIWGHDSDVLNNHVEVYISYLRKKLKLLNANVEIKTIRGVGYTLKEQNV